MSDVKTPSQIQSGIFNTLLGVTSDGALAKAAISNLQQMFRDTVFLSSNVNLSSEITAPGVFRVKGSEEPALPNGDKIQPWGAILVLRAGTDLLQIAFTADGSVAYRFIADGIQSNPKPRSWNMLTQ